MAASSNAEPPTVGIVSSVPSGKKKAPPPRPATNPFMDAHETIIVSGNLSTFKSSNPFLNASNDDDDEEEDFETTNPFRISNPTELPVMNPGNPFLSPAENKLAAAAPTSPRSFIPVLHGKSAEKPSRPPAHRHGNAFVVTGAILPNTVTSPPPAATFHQSATATSTLSKPGHTVHPNSSDVLTLQTASVSLPKAHAPPPPTQTQIPKPHSLSYSALPPNKHTPPARPSAGPSVAAPPTAAAPRSSPGSGPSGKTSSIPTPSALPKPAPTGAAKERASGANPELMIVSFLCQSRPALCSVNRVVLCMQDIVLNGNLNVVNINRSNKQFHP